MSTELEQVTGAENGGFSSFEVDAIGEILNISMGSAATAVSTLLDKKVLITTPQVSVKKVSEIDFGSLEPSMCVEITYVEGISGSNIMVLKQSDVKMILDQLMGMEPTPPGEDFEFDEISISAACEVMNQMMGSSATALSNFLGRCINISTPQAYLLANTDIQKKISEDTSKNVVVTTFDLTIEGIMNSKFMSVLQMELAKEIVAQTNSSYATEPEPEPAPAPAMPEPAPEPSGGGTLDQAMIDALLNGGGASAPAPAPEPSSGGPLDQAAIDALLGGGGAPAPQPVMQAPVQPEVQYAPPPMQAPMYQMPQYQQPQAGYQPANVVKQQPVDIQNAQFQSFNPNQTVLPEGQHANLDLIMSVPLQVSVEIGKTKKKIKEILEFTQGTIIELERQAGAPVDVIVNGQLVARGDVVVIEDNFGVRITEILKNADFLNGIS